jgi:hypothetical protein
MFLPMRPGAAFRSGVLVVALVAGLVACGSASASSIFFLRNNNIWVANPDGSDAQAVTTNGTASDPYDFVSSAKTGTAPPIGFHMGGGSASVYGTLNPDGSGLTINPYNSSMGSDGQVFTRLDDAGDQMTWAAKQDTAQYSFFAGAVATNGSNPYTIYNLGGMDARQTAFANPAGTALLYTDTGNNYSVGGSSPCNGTDFYTDVLVISANGQSPADIYCEDSSFLGAPAMNPVGTLIAATLTGNQTGDYPQIVTIPVSGGVATASAQSAGTQITPPTVGVNFPDFSPDGTQIVFQGPGSTIETVPVGGGTPTQILTNASVPAWSPYTLPAGGGSGGSGGGSGGSGGGSGGSGGSGGATPVRLTLRAAAVEHAIAQHGLTATVSCSIACAVSLVGELGIRGVRTPLRTRIVNRSLRAQQSATVTLTLSGKQLSKLKQALARHKRVTAVIVSVARAGSAKVTKSATVVIKR